MNIPFRNGKILPLIFQLLDIGHAVFIVTGPKILHFCWSCPTGL